MRLLHTLTHDWESLSSVFHIGVVVKNIGIVHEKTKVSSRINIVHNILQAEDEGGGQQVLDLHEGQPTQDPC